MTPFATLSTKSISSFEELNQAVTGADREVLQIEHGKLTGRLSHAVIDNVIVDIGNFNRGLRSRGSWNKKLVTIGTTTESDNRVTRSSFESNVGDIMVALPGEEIANRYYCGVSYAVVQLSFADIEEMFGREGKLGDPTTWRTNHFTGNQQATRRTIQSFGILLEQLGRGEAFSTAEMAEFWRRAIVEAMTENMVVGTPSMRDGPLPSALKLVRDVEEYLDSQNTTLIHISQICSQLRVSRRTLHRAFHNALGIGPIAFLQHRRLSAARLTLRTQPPGVTRISDLALQHGFLNVGRFAHYYRRLFGELPSETRAPEFSLSAVSKEG